MTDRKLLVGAVALVPGRIRGSIPAGSRARDEVEALLPTSFFERAPFQKISLILRYGGQTNLAPEYQRIASGILPIAVELNMGQLCKADPDAVYHTFRKAIIAALIAVAERYDLPCDLLREAREINPTKPYTPP